MAQQVRTDLVVNMGGTAARDMKDLATRTQEAADVTRRLKAEQQSLPRIGAAGGIGATLPGLGSSNRPGASTAPAGFESRVDQIFNTAISRAKQASEREQGEAEKKQAEGAQSAIKYGAALALATGQINSAAKGLEVLGNNAVSTEGKIEGVAGAIPLIGGALQGVASIVHTLNGDAQNLRNLQRDTAAALAGAAALARSTQVERAENFGATNRRAQANAAAGSAAFRFALPGFAGGTVDERNAFAAAERTLPARRQAFAAGQEASALSEQSLRIRGQIEQTEARLDKARAFAENTARGLARGGFGSRDEQTGFVKKALEAEAEVDRHHNDLLTQKNQLRDVEEKRIQAVGRQQKSNLDIERDRLTVLKEQEQRITGQLQSFGALSRVERQQFARAAERLNQVGIERLTPQEKALIARGGGGEALAREQEKSAQQDPFFRQGFAALGLPTEDVGGIRQAIPQLTARMEQEVEKQRAALTEQLADMFSKISASIIEMTREAIQDAERKARVEALQRNAQVI
jgi:hypothetical protein